jgi:hypothetical protein
VYDILLCTFPRPDSIKAGTMLNIEDFHPAILRVNKQIYAESYEAMISDTRFVHVCSTGGLHFANMCKANNVATLAFYMVDGKAF